MCTERRLLSQSVYQSRKSNANEATIKKVRTNSRKSRECFAAESRDWLPRTWYTRASDVPGGSLRGSLLTQVTKAPRRLSIAWLLTKLSEVVSANE